MIFTYNLNEALLFISYATGIYHPLKADIISKIYHPFRKERISLKKAPTKSMLFSGGAEENRTPVRKPIRRPFYTLSEVFVVSLIPLRLTGSALGSPLMC